MAQKILLVTTAHKYDDDRIFYHQARELNSRGFLVKIISLNSSFVGLRDGIEVEAYSILHLPVKTKIEKIVELGSSYQPDCILCSEPLAVIAVAHIMKGKKRNIIYDVTEWYPSRSMLRDIPYPKKYLSFFKFLAFSFFAASKSSSFIFGEHDKQWPIRVFFPFKKKLILPYYPSNRYVVDSSHDLKNDIVLCYTGSLSREKGLDNFFKVVKELHVNTQLKFSVLIIGKPISKNDEKHFKLLLEDLPNVNITYKEPSSFLDFSKTLSEADLCFDLREYNWENHHSLPIKLFYYMGSSKPVIYSKLRAIEKHLDVSKFGYLVDPSDTQRIVDCIIHYSQNPKFYKLHAENARKAFSERFSWEHINESFVDFVSNSIKNGAK